MREEFIEMYRGINMLEANGVVEHIQAMNMKDALLMSIIDWLMEMNANETRRENPVLDRGRDGEEGVRADC